MEINEIDLGVMLFLGLTYVIEHFTKSSVHVQV